MSTTPQPTSTSTSMPSNPPPISSSTTIPDVLSTQANPPSQDHPTTTTPSTSTTIIIPRADLPTAPARTNYPPSSACAMSPRRNSAETDKISEEMREAQLHAKNLQSGLIAIAEKIDTIKADHERLEKQNVALQDYIGGLTRSMSRTGTDQQGGKK